MDAETTYRQARKDGKGPADACYAVKKAHPEISFEQLTDLSWLIESGKPTPDWAKSGTDDAIDDPTGERRAWERGAEKAMTGE